MGKHIALTVSLILAVTACSTNAGTVSVTVRETAAEITEVTEETIHMNNCGGSRDSEQTAEKSKSVQVEVGGSLEVDLDLVKREVTAKYSEVTGVSKSQKLSAAPGTNMEFNLKWTEKTWIGIVTAQGKDGQGNYRVSVPISVELISSQDLGCGASIPVSTNSPVSLPASVKLGKLLFKEDFDGNINQWPTGTDDKGATFYMDSGEYHVVGSESDRYGGWLAPSKRPEQNFGNFYLEMKARYVAGAQQDDAYGILFRYSDISGGPYILMIGNAQQVYSLHADKTLLWWTYSPRIIKNGTNIIGVLCEGNTITIFINGYQVDSIEANYSKAGGIGIAYASYQHTAFDYFYVWELSK